MSRRFDQDDLARVRDRTDLVGLVAAHGVDLRRAGTNHKGLCPFHEERTPSFTVRADEGYFHCFGCGEGGDAIAFHMKATGAPFPDAVRELAALAGVTLREDPDPEADRLRTAQTNARTALEVAVRYYRDQLRSPAARRARDELTTRHLTPATADGFECGYAPHDPAELLAELHRAQVTQQAAADAGIISLDDAGPRPLLRDRLVFPIRDHTGRLVGLAGRALNQHGPKYLNSPEGLLFHKAQLLYGWTAAHRAIRSTGRVLIVEGYTDVLAAHQAGVQEAVACCGTAVGEAHFDLIRRRAPHGTKIVLCFDPDEGGQKAARRAWEQGLSEANRLFTVPLENGDPCDHLTAEGEAATRAALGKQTGLTRWLLEQIAKNADPTPEGRSVALSDMGALVRRIPDASLRTSYEKLLHSWGGPPPEQAPQPRQEPASTPARPTGWQALQRRVIRRLLVDPCTVWPTFESDAAPALTDAAARNVLAATKAAAMRLNPLAAATRGWIGAVTDAAAALDTSADVASILDTDDDPNTATSVLVETLWRTSEEQTRTARRDQIVAQLSTATGTEAERLWAELDQLTT